MSRQLLQVLAPRIPAEMAQLDAWPQRRVLQHCIEVIYQEVWAPALFQFSRK